MWFMALWANPLVRKITLYAAALLAIFLCLRWYGNREYYKGISTGKAAMATDIEAKVTERLKAEREQLAADRKTLDGDRIKVDAARAELARGRATLQTALTSSLERFTSTREADNATVMAIPDAGLVRAIRAVSAELAAGKPAPAK